MDISDAARPSAEQMNQYMIQWQAWLESISAQDQLAEGGNHLASNGVVLKPGNVVDKNVYKVNDESVAGYILIWAKDMNDAIRLAKPCPILQGVGTSVEIRQTASPGK